MEEIMINDDRTPYLSTNKVAVIFGVSTRTVARWCSEGRFPGSLKTDDDSGRWRIPQRAIDLFIENRLDLIDKE